MVKAYSETWKNIKAILEALYIKYSDDARLNYADMVKYSRLKTLEDTIKAELLSLTAKNAKVLEKSLSDIFMQSYFYTGFILETEAQVKLAYALINPDVVRIAIENPISGLTLNDRLMKNKQAIVFEVRQQLTQGLIQGESYQKMANRIKDTLENDAVKAKRVVATETHRVREDAKQASYEKANQKGLEFEKIWVSTLDSKTRREHKKLDGQKADKDGYFYVGRFKAKNPGGFGVAAEDINCRCTTIVRPKYLPVKPDVRRARDSNNKGEIIPYTKYEDWYQNRVIESN